MVSECVNQKCRAQFLYFRRGKLVAVPRRRNSPSGSHVQFLWLCGDCVRDMNLQISLTGDVSLISTTANLECSVLQVGIQPS